MNWAQFRKNVGMHVQVEPPACRLDINGHVLPEVHDDWLIEQVNSNDVIVLRNLRTDHIAELGKDHIYDFPTNPSRSNGTVKFGFLILKVQLFMRGPELWVRPNAKPGEPVAPSGLLHHRVQWTPYMKFDASASIPASARKAKIQYRLWADEGDVPLLMRIASLPDGGYCQEVSGPSGVIGQTIIENQTFYISFSHPKVLHDIRVISFDW